MSVTCVAKHRPGTWAWHVQRRQCPRRPRPAQALGAQGRAEVADPDLPPTPSPPCPPRPWPRLTEGLCPRPGLCPADGPPGTPTPRGGGSAGSHTGVPCAAPGVHLCQGCVPQNPVQLVSCRVQRLRKRLVLGPSNDGAPPGHSPPRARGPSSWCPCPGKKHLEQDADSPPAHPP